MPRTVEVTLPPDQADELVRELRGFGGLLSLRLERGVSLQPPGDVVKAALLTRSLPEFMRLLERWAGRGRWSVTTQELDACISAGRTQEIARDNSEAIWEEMEHEIAKSSNMTGNMMLVMALSGMIAAIGIVTTAVDLVIGAMMIAPGFEPLVRIGLGWANRSPAWKRGFGDAAKGYACLIGAAAGTGAVFQAAGHPFGSGQVAAFASHWMWLTAPSAAMSAAAIIAGTLLVATHRTVLTSGVMVALSLIPGAAIIGLALAAGNGGMLRGALERWGWEMGEAIVLSTIVFGIRQWRHHRRRMWA